MKHTRGPWAVTNHRDITSGDGVVVESPWSCRGIEEADSNARLIAAAPDMFQELEFLMDYCLEKRTRQYADGSEYEVEVIRSYESEVERIKKLIAKIKGA